MDKNLPAKVRALVAEICQHMDAKVKEYEAVRQPVRMRTKKPVPIKQFNPRFEEEYEWDLLTARCYLHDVTRGFADHLSLPVQFCHREGLRSGSREV